MIVIQWIEPLSLLKWSERKIAYGIDALSVNLECERFSMSARNRLVQVVYDIDWLSIDFHEDVSNLHLSVPGWRICVNQEHHHAWLVHHRAHAKSKVDSLRVYHPSIAMGKAYRRYKS